MIRPILFLTLLISSPLFADEQYDRWCALGAAAKKSLNEGRDAEAKALAGELAQLAPKYSTDWNYGNAIQDFNIVLGRLALKSGDLEQAEKRLLAAGKSPGSPQMDSFGPNMTLARDLLLKKRTAVVLVYFELCRKFWARDPKGEPLDQMHDRLLDQWRDQVRTGLIPDFGANLLY